MPVAIVILGVLLAAGPTYCRQEIMVFEAEDCSSPESAWGKDITPVDKWNLWSKDKDAETKWSGGVVLQSPPVMADRETEEEGAPVLHTVLTGIPDGAWVVTIKYGRDLGVSLDGKEWKRLSSLGGRLGRFEITGGQFEFWVDDRYAQESGPGFSYYDTITLTPSMPEANGVSNGGFEFGPDFAGSGWVWWSREGVGGAELVEEAHSGGRAVKFTHEGERDYALTNSGRLAVRPGQAWEATAWMKCEDTAGADLAVVAMGQGKLISWNIASDGVWATEDWKQVKARADIPQGCDQIYVRVVGSGKATVWVDDVALTEAEPLPPPRPKVKVEGWATERVWEKVDRGLIAVPLGEGKVYLGWRLLADDPADVGFNVYRGTGRMRPVKINEQPITKTTDFTDTEAPAGMDNTYFIRAVQNGQEQTPSQTAHIEANSEPQAYLSIKLQGDYTFQKLGVGDLDGDGRLDYVIKQPQDNIDPYSLYWQPSPDTYKLEAYNADGAFLWRYDMGWAIERGIWYSPYVVWDFDGDGKAEVAVKSGEGDPRGPDGRVMSAPEYVSILDGETGQVKDRVEWPHRDLIGRGPNGYNVASRNQIGVAYLDGKTPCLLVARGTYGVMVLVAYQFHEGKLQELWTWKNTEETEGNWRGQGAHWMHSGDVDGDGRDEVILGSCVIDDDGKGLWTTGLGHPDRCFLTDVDPARPGMEIFYVIEPPRQDDGVCLVDARTGEIIWKIGERTYHVGMGMCADVDPMYPGSECWAGEDPKGDPAGERYHGAAPRWLFTAQGEMLARDEKSYGSYNAVYWDGDTLREICQGGRLTKYNGQVVTEGLQGGQQFWGDILGDWREEIVTTVPGEIRIYTTTIPASDRRVTLLQDPVYRYDVAHEAMGYTQPPVTSYAITQTGPATWLGSSDTALRAGETTAVTAYLSAPPEEAVAGTFTLTVPEGLSVTPQSVEVQAAAGGIAQAEFRVTLNQGPPLLSGGRIYTLQAVFDGPEGLSASATIKAQEELISAGPIVQAENFSGQEGGEVQIRQDKAGVVGECFSHWDNQGHRLSWKVQVDEAARYRVVLRYCTPGRVKREARINDGPAIEQTFHGTGGFGGDAGDWAHAALKAADGQDLVLDLAAGTHLIELTNVDGVGMNVDYIALVEVAR